MQVYKFIKSLCLAVLMHFRVIRANSEQIWKSEWRDSQNLRKADTDGLALLASTEHHSQKPDRKKHSGEFEGNHQDSKHWIQWTAKGFHCSVKKTTEKSITKLLYE